ncbi:hypothetical protein BH10ACI3_BH10ACI3_18180 [soil metagenome]
MYRRPKFLEKLLEIRREMALEADYDVDLFAEIARSGNRSARGRQSPAERMAARVEAKDADVPDLIKTGDV